MGRRRHISADRHAAAPRRSAAQLHADGVVAGSRDGLAEVLSPSDGLILFCGMSIGYEDPTVSYARTRQRLRAMGIRDKPIAPRAPWQNGFAERLIGSIRRECLDHIIVFGEAHLRGLLCAYADYYNRTRTHRSL